MKEIKAIRTIYNGVEYRSRLEARWALFFDYCKIQYNYEIEGYSVNGVNYLPDFYLSESQLWVEVKPNLDFLQDSISNHKISEFSKAIDKPVLVFVDVPSKAKYYLADKTVWLPDILSNRFKSCLVFWVDNKKDQYQPIIIDTSGLSEVFSFLASNHKF